MLYTYITIYGVVYEQFILIIPTTYFLGTGRERYSVNLLYSIFTASSKETFLQEFSEIQKRMLPNFLKIFEEI